MLFKSQKRLECWIWLTPFDFIHVFARWSLGCFAAVLSQFLSLWGVDMNWAIILLMQGLLSKIKICREPCNWIAMWHQRNNNQIASRKVNVMLKKIEGDYRSSPVFYMDLFQKSNRDISWNRFSIQARLCAGDIHSKKVFPQDWIQSLRQNQHSWSKQGRRN